MMDSAVHHLGGVLSAPGVFLNFFDELPVGVCIMDKTGHIMLANTAYEQLTGAARENIIGLGCLHALRCDYCLRGCPVHAGNGTQIDSFEPQKSEATIINRERRKLTVRLTIAPLLDGKGRQVGIVETVTSAAATGEHEIPGPGTYSFGGLIGKSPQIERVFKMVPSVAQTDSSVLITGETGTGKDMLAEAIHKASERSGGPFIKVNCGALPDTLLESELFGHAKGAFTGADQDKPGRFRLAHGGTLFLTEIGDLPLHLQVKLLSFLDDKVIYPLGSTKGAVSDVRVVVATHRDLESMVRENRFRQDLFFRLNVIRLHLPPMRERGRDVTLLQDHFLRRFCQRFGKNITGFSERAIDLLDTYPYPGNVRELRNVIEYAVNFCDGEIIHVRHLPSYLRRPDAVPGPLPEPTSLVTNGNGMPPFSMDAAPGNSMGHTIGTDANWEDVERRMILDALVKSGGRKHKAAAILGWGRSTLWRKMKNHGLD
ncbi:MAG: sigma-54 interaction domain-containing protein [Desulfovibrio sp.]|uniref:sigma-54 interaction domain-containing protein n=1 Tax=Desulfovibrio sp. 7SRBS1 TaxID=3378064 RepID=UPI003B4059FF